MDSLSAIILSCKWQCIVFKIAIDQKCGEMFHHVLYQNGSKHVQNIFLYILTWSPVKFGCSGIWSLILCRIDRATHFMTVKM